MVESPQVSIDPPPPTSTALSGVMPVVAVSKTDGATLRYTLDGSRPTEQSPPVPAGGIPMAWPAASRPINVRGFKEGLRPSVTNGLIFELDYGMGRKAPGPGGHPGRGAASGVLDGISSNGSSEAVVRGWAVDTALARGGWLPVVVSVHLDGEPVAAALANEPRPDLPKAKVAPNAEHGFTVRLSADASARLASSGKHAVSVNVIGSPSTEQPWRLPGSPMCLCDGAACAC